MNLRVALILDLLERREDKVEAGRNRRILSDPGIADHASGIDEEQHALTEPIALAKYAVLLGHCAMRPEIAEEWEADVLALGPGSMRPMPVDANPQDLRIIAMNIFECLLNQRQLGAADGRPIGWVESQQTFLS